MTSLNLTSSPVQLSADLIDIESPSHHEQEIADAIFAALSRIDGAETARIKNTVLARTDRGLGSRVILAGHIDTVPLADNTPHRLSDGILHGCGAVDMKTGLAVYLNAFATLAASDELSRDITLVCYEGEEVSTEYNGLGFVESELPDWLTGDVALLGEPSGGIIEAGCQGTIRVRVTAHGTRAHSARAWLGENAAHRLAPVLTRINEYEPRRVTIDGCEYREGINVVKLDSFVATNTIPDTAEMLVNFRFAPDRSVEEAMAHLNEVLGEEASISVEVDDVAAAALPGLSQPAAAELVAAVGGEFRAKFGWTDVSRFSTLGIPAVNFGPGDPGFAHKPDEQCPVDQITHVADVLRTFLTSSNEG